MKGFKDKEKRFHPITEYKKGTRKSRDQSAKSQGIVVRKQRSQLPFDEALKRFESFVNSTNLNRFTFDPRTNKGYSFTTLEERKEFQRKFVIPKGSANTVYIIARTNNIVNEIANVPPRSLQSEYVLTKNPFFGGFENDAGDLFVDISFPLSGVSEEEAIAKARNLAQESVLFITGSGRIDVIDTEISKVPTKGFRPV